MDPSQPSYEERVSYLTALARKRGYVNPTFGVLGAADIAAVEAIDGLSSTVYLSERGLSRAVKEIIFVITFTMQHMPTRAIANHIQMAIEHGMTPQEVLEAIEMLIPHAGIPVFTRALDAWVEAVKPESIEIDVPVGPGGMLTDRPSLDA